MLRHPRRLVVCACATALGCFGATSASAEQPAAYELRYEPAEGCPADAPFRDDVLAHVHDTSRSAGARVAVRIEAQASGFHGELVATDDEGHEGRRSLDGATCADVAHALAFLAGLAIELGGHLEKSEEPPKPVAPPPPAPPPPKPAPAPPPPKPVEPHGSDISVAALGELRTGLAPALRPALALAFDIEQRRRRVLTHAYRLAVVGATSELARSDGSASLRYLAGRAEDCPLRLDDARLVVRACFAFELGYVWAKSHATTNPRDQGQLWPSAEALVRVKYGIVGGLFAELDVAGGVPILRPRYYFEPDRVLYEVPVLTAQGGLGLGYRF